MGQHSDRIQIKARTVRTLKKHERSDTTCALWRYDAWCDAAGGLDTFQVPLCWRMPPRRGRGFATNLVVRDLVLKPIPLHLKLNVYYQLGRYAAVKLLPRNSAFYLDLNFTPLHLFGFVLVPQELLSEWLLEDCWWFHTIGETCFLCVHGFEGP